MRKGLLIVTVLIEAIGLSACGLMQRSSDSGYGTWDDEYGWRSVRDDSGGDRTEARSLDRNQTQSLEERLEVRHMEENLTTESERKQYERYRPHLRTNREKIEFLSLRDEFARERWMKSRDTSTGRAKEFDRVISSAIEEGDLVIGMTMQDVQNSWGDPDERYVAGDQTFGNARWIYTSFTPSPDGYLKEKRIVLFERGVVIGWQKQ